MFTEQDVINLKTFKNILENGSFQIKGEAVLPVSELFKWFYTLEGKIRAELSPKRKLPEIKEAKKK